MNQEISSSTENKSEQARKAFQISVLPVLGIPIVAAYLIYQAIQTSLWQFWAMSITLGILIVSGIISLMLIRRGRHELGTWIIFTGWIPVVIVLSALFSGLGFAIFFGTLLINSLVATQKILPPRQANALTILGAAGGLIALMEDLFLNTERLNYPLFQQIVTYLILIVVLIYTYTIIRQFREYSLRTKLVVVSVAAVLAAVAIQGFITNRTTSAHLREDQETGLFSAASQTAASIDEHIDGELNNVRVYAQITDFQKYLDTPANQRDERLQQETSSSLQNLIKKDPLYIKSHALVDANGIDVLDTNGEAIGASYAGEDFFEQPFQTNLPYVSNVRFLEDGTAVLYFASPVHGAGGDTVGVLVVTYDAAILQKWLVQNNSILGPASFPVLLDENHIRLAHGIAPTLNFKSVVPLSAAKLAELQGAGRLPGLPTDELSTNLPAFEEALNKADTTPNFTTQLVATGEVSNYGSVVYMKTRPWQVAYFQPVSVYIEPLQAQTRSSLLVTIGIGLVVALAAFFVSQALSGPITRLTAVAEKVSAGDLNAQAEIESSDEIGTLAGAFNSMTARLREFIGNLEERVKQRTYGLELAAEVGRSVSQVRNLDMMLKDAVDIIRSRFDLYYVQVYLTNPGMTSLILRSGTGTVGAELVRRSHSLPLDATSINGRAATERKSVVISDTLSSVTFKPNPLLPETRSEMSVPLIVADKVVGVLDMQSEQVGALGRENLTTFEALAGQVAIAIQNSILLAETEQARAEVEAQAKRLVRAGWQDYLDAIHAPEHAGFVFEQNKVVPLTEAQTPAGDNAIASPIAVVGEPVGNLVVELEGQGENPQAKELVSLVAGQVAQRVENLRLLESAERYRIEAEESARRSTREGWKTYKENTDEVLSYIYNLKEVQPVSGNLPEWDATAVPLKVRDEIIGELAIQGFDTNDKEMVELVNAVADRLSTHIENLRQFDETMRGQIELDKRAQQLAAVAEISTISSQELNVEKMLESVVHLTQRRFGLYHAHVFIFDETTQNLAISACGWKEGDEHEGTHGTTTIPITQEQSLVARAARTRQAVIVNNVRNEAGWLPNPLLPDTASELAVPMIVGEQLLGVLDVQSDHFDAFTEEDANIQTTLASQVATAIQNAQSFSKAQLQAQRESALNVISQKIQSATTVEAVLQIAARELGHALGAPMTIAQLNMKDSSS